MANIGLSMIGSGNDAILDKSMPTAAHLLSNSGIKFQQACEALKKDNSSKASAGQLSEGARVRYSPGTKQKQ